MGARPIMPKEWRILYALKPGVELSSYQLQKASGLWWSFYPTIMRMEEAGLVLSRWETSKRPWSPRRRLYRRAIPDGSGR